MRGFKDNLEKIEFLEEIKVIIKVYKENNLKYESENWDSKICACEKSNSR